MEVIGTIVYVSKVKIQTFSGPFPEAPDLFKTSLITPLIFRRRQTLTICSTFQLRIEAFLDRYYYQRLRAYPP